jgi:hypothetical protein
MLSSLCSNRRRCMRQPTHPELARNGGDCGQEMRELEVLVAATEDAVRMIHASRLQEAAEKLIEAATHSKKVLRALGVAVVDRNASVRRHDTRAAGLQQQVLALRVAGDALVEQSKKTARPSRNELGEDRGQGAARSRSESGARRRSGRQKMRGAKPA